MALLAALARSSRRAAAAAAAAAGRPPPAPAAAARAAPARTAFSYPAPRSLDSVVKVDMLRDYDAQKCAALWEEYHNMRQLASTTMGARLYALYLERAQRSPMFVVPMRADEDSPADGDSAADPDASEAPVAPPAAAPPLNIFVQQQGAHVLFSDLEEYKLLGTEATPLATLTHYADLAEDKAIVLARLDVVREKAFSLARARELLALTHRLWVDDQAHALVQKFNHEPGSFDFSDVLALLGHEK